MCFVRMRFECKVRTFYARDFSSLYVNTLPHQRMRYVTDYVLPICQVFWNCVETSAAPGVECVVGSASSEMLVRLSKYKSYGKILNFLVMKI